MIPQNIIDEVFNIDIVEFIGKHVQLTKKGVNYTGKCPFHDEKTASFSVSSAKQIYKCFGCGQGGNLVQFYMKYTGVDFPTAVRKIASDYNIAIPEEKYTEQEEKEFKHKESLLTVMRFANEYFVSRLYLPENKAVHEYALGRWNEETLQQFQIGFAPDGWDGFIKYAKSNGCKEEYLFECGLVREKKDKSYYDYFRNRLMFPIFDKYNRVIAFTGRDMSNEENTAKYLNSPDTPLFNKGKVLYGLNFARNAMREKGYVHLVEGHADCIKLHMIGKYNTVASGGTALTVDQLVEIKKICNSVTEIYDNDKAGKMAAERSGELIIQSGMYCNIVELPSEDGKKNDPDSFFTDDKQFDEFVGKHIADFIIWYASSRKEKTKNPDLKSKLIDKVCGWIVKLPETGHDLYIEQLSQMVKPKKVWESKLKSLLKDEVKEEKVFQIPKHVSLNDFERFGFYEEMNCYFFKTGQGVKQGSNFTLEPLFHIPSVTDAKRLFKITNEYGYSIIIELPQKDLNGISPFKLRVESLGNFLFEGTEADLNKLKRSLYEKTRTCFEIKQLGWQRDGKFFAWANGIYNGSFIEVDKNGIIAHGEKFYYIPSCSGIYSGEDNLFVNERKFKYNNNGNISFKDISKHFIDVYGDQAAIGLCFYMATLFSDLIVKKFNSFPILDLFGPKGAGKTEMAVSLLQFFGNHKNGPALASTTRPALADHIAVISNGLVHVDEYKNSLAFEVIEFLKGLYNRDGRSRMNMDKDKKKETTNVDSGIIISGQEMPTADIALFSRLIFLSFHQVEYDDDAKQRYARLKEIEKIGLTHITHEFLSFRDYFIANYFENHALCMEELKKAIGNFVIEDRIFNNWLVVLAAYRTLKDKVQMCYDYNKVLQIAAELVVRQNSETKKSNELAIFWGIFEFLFRDGQLEEGADFKIEFINRLATNKINSEWTVAKHVLMIDHTRIFQLYRMHGNKTKENILPLKTLEYYLQNCPEYFGKKQSVSFKIRSNNPDDYNANYDKRKVTTSMAFDYDAITANLGICLHNEHRKEDELILPVVKANNKQPVLDFAGEDKEDLPF